jgi:hypothetical protein
VKRNRCLQTGHGQRGREGLVSRAGVALLRELTEETGLAGG